MPGPLTKAVSAALRAAVEEQGLTQSQIGAALGQSQSQISKYLRGEVVLDIEELATICKLLKIDTAALIASSTPDTEPQ
jgi:transcriptional regulator with XRE-family HTH domain